MFAPRIRQLHAPERRRRRSRFSVLLAAWLVAPAFFGETGAETSSALASRDAPSGALELRDLAGDNPQLQRLRLEIAGNLRSAARQGRLAHPLRFVRYTVRENENFFQVMARVSQDADTLASLNELANPNAVAAGDALLIPNARGIFASGDDRADVAKRYELSPERVIELEAPERKSPPGAGRSSSDDASNANAAADARLFFLPGRKYLPGEMRYFRGEGFASPLDGGRISSRFGTRRDPFTNRLTFHGGLDIAAPAGTPVLASRAGRVVRAESAGGYGKLVILKHEYGYATYYGHLSQILVRVGEQVSAGHVIGRVGSTGRSTGPHLHFEVRKHGLRTNPANHVEALRHR